MSVRAKVRLRSGEIASVTIRRHGLPAGGNFEEPVTQATLKVVGAFPGLSRERSDARKYPPSTPSTRGQSIRAWWTWRAWRRPAASSRRSSEINQMMKVIGEEGTSAEDYILYQKGELLDAVYLQQNSFDPIDAACEPERQAHEFNVLYDVLTRDYALSDKKGDPRLLQSGASGIPRLARHGLRHAGICGAGNEAHGPLPEQGNGLRRVSECRRFIPRSNPSSATS